MKTQFCDAANKRVHQSKSIYSRKMQFLKNVAFKFCHNLGAFLAAIIFPCGLKLASLLVLIFNCKPRPDRLFSTVSLVDCLKTISSTSLDRYYKRSLTVCTIDLIPWPCGLMDKAPASGAGDCRFESCQGRINFSQGDLSNLWSYFNSIFRAVVVTGGIF